MLKDDKATVRYMYITNARRAKLLAYAAKKHVAQELIDRAATVMMSPRDADLHDDHVHVRIACPEASRAVCVEEAAPGVARGAAKGDDGARADGAGPGDSALVDSGR